MNVPHSPEDRLHTLIGIIDQAQTGIREGRIKDLSSMKFEAERLCADIISLPPAEARNLQPLIGELISRLDSLEQALVHIKENTGA